jgi:hypothetical protein
MLAFDPPYGPIFFILRHYRSHLPIVVYFFLFYFGFLENFCLVFRLWSIYFLALSDTLIAFLTGGFALTLVELPTFGRRFNFPAPAVK